MCINIGGVHQFIGHCYIPLDPCEYHILHIFFYADVRLGEVQLIEGIRVSESDELYNTIDRNNNDAPDNNNNNDDNDDDRVDNTFDSWSWQDNSLGKFFLIGG